MAQQPLKLLEKKPGVPYMPTHEKVVAEMLKVAKVGKNDILYDLGSGEAASSLPPPRSSAPTASAWTLTRP